MKITSNNQNNTIYSKICTELITSLKTRTNVSPLEMISIYSIALQNKFHNYVSLINVSMDTVFKEESSTFTEWNHELHKCLLEDTRPSIESLAHAKYFLDQIFFEQTEEGTLNFSYYKHYLLTSVQVQEELNISRATLSRRYTNHGLEMADGHGHHRYPKHVIYYWKNDDWASKIKSLHYSYKIRYLTKQEVIKELEEDIKKFEIKYNGTFESLYINVENPTLPEKPSDYYNWKDAIEELNSLNSQE